MSFRKILIGVLAFAVLGLGACSQKTNATDATTASTTKGIVTTTTETETWTLPDMTGYSTEQVKATLEASPLQKYQVIVKEDLTYGDAEGEYQYEKFYGYAGSANVAGASVSVSKKLNVYVTAYNLPSTVQEFINENTEEAPELVDLYKSVTLEGKNYTGTSFTKTGLGEVEVVSYVDGDTTRFKDPVSGETISLRYLGVDTPESTAAFEAWGKAASAYTKECLSNAKKVVLEADAAGQKDSNERYLGWVWYLDQSDVWHLLQLEQVLNCYTKDKADSDSTYGQIITSIGTIIQRTGRRVWGEHDPNFDYSTDPKVVSLEELRTNFAAYYSRKVTVTGVVAMLDGYSPVIVDPETGYGVYFYIPSWMATGAYDVKVGNKITITGVATYYGADSSSEDLDNMDEDLGNGSPQLTDFKEKNVTLVESGTYLDTDGKVTVNPTVLTISSIDATDIGRYCKLENLTITKVYEASTKSGFTVTCSDESGNTISLRIDDSHYYIAGSNEDGLAMTDFKVGSTIKSVTGYLSYYYGYQVGLVSKTMIDFGE